MSNDDGWSAFYRMRKLVAAGKYPEMTGIVRANATQARLPLGAANIWKAVVRCSYVADGNPVNEDQQYLLAAPDVQAARSAAAEVAQEHARADARLYVVTVLSVSTIQLPTPYAAIATQEST